MKLNEKDKIELINFLKKEYNNTKDMLDNDNYYWLKEKEQREKHIEYLKTLKEKYETLESQEEIEIPLELNFDNFSSKKNDFWWSIVGLIAVCALFGGFKDNSIDNLEPKSDDLN